MSVIQEKQEQDLPFQVNALLFPTTEMQRVCLQVKQQNKNDTLK